MKRCWEHLIHYGNSRWTSGGPKNSAQQLSTVAFRSGMKVAYVGPTRQRLSRCSRNFRIFSPGPQGFTRASDLLSIYLADWSCRPENTVILISYATPGAAALCAYFHDRGFPILYRHVDWFEEDPSLGAFTLVALEQICAQSDCIALSHPGLVGGLPDCRAPRIVVSNGLDSRFTHLRTDALPSDIRHGQLTLGYWGSLWGDRIDWPLVNWLATRHPEWQWNFVGDLGLRGKTGPLPANVHFLGAKHPRLTQAYISAFDVCLVPFRQDRPLARYANPIKALEYLACGRPVVSPYNESLRDYPGVLFYVSAEEAEARILESRARFSQTTSQRIKIVAENTWASRLEQLFCGLSQALNHLPASIPITLPAR